MSNKSADQHNLYGDSLKPETVFRVHRHEREYLQVANATIQDRRLSWEARGLLVYLLSLPKDWEIRVSHLQKQGDAGRDALRRMLHELQRFGYASGVGRESQDRGDLGRFGSTEIAVYETPDLNPFHAEAQSPSPENPSTVAPSPDLPSPENPSPYKRHSPQRTQETKHTHRNLRAVGASVEGVCVSGFSRQFREHYAEHFGLGGGWLNQSDPGKYDGTILAELKRLNLYTRAAAWCSEEDAELLAVQVSQGMQQHVPSGAPASGRSAAHDHTCPGCFGSEWETVPGQGSRRCTQSSAQGATA